MAALGGPEGAGEGSAHPAPSAPHLGHSRAGGPGCAQPGDACAAFSQQGGGNSRPTVTVTMGTAQAGHALGRGGGQEGADLDPGGCR